MASFCSVETRLRRSRWTGGSGFICIRLFRPFKLSKSQLGQTTPDGLVVDPFAGSGTTGLAAISQNRRCLLIDNNATYCQVAQRRLSEEAVIPKSNGHYSEHESNGHEQVKLLDAPSSKPMPKSKPVRYSISKRKK
jgi:hypothetical protein